jgi:type II secretory pathway pseudopilin PulG
MLVTLRRFLNVLAALVRARPAPALAPSRVCHGGTAVAIRCMRSRRSRRTRGTSLMDVLVGIVIAGILMGIAVPTIPALMDPYRLSFAARVVASELSVARMKAIAQNRRHRITFDTTAGTYQLQVETAANTWTAVSGVRGLPSGCTFGAVATPPTFDTQGQLGQAYDIALHSASQTKTVSVNILGNVQINAS